MNKLHNLRKSFTHAVRGIAFCVRYERNMRIHMVATAYVIFFGASFYDFTRTEWILLILTCASVISLEIINTAIEVLTDKASPEFSALARAAKDTAAGAVLVAAIAAVAVGMILFWDVERFWLIFGYFADAIWLFIALVCTVILSCIFIFSGKERRKRGQRK